MKKRALFLLTTVALFTAASANASEEAPQALNLDGRLFSNTGGTETALLDTGTFKIQILDYNGTCVLYEEEQVFDTRGSNGAFNIQVGEKSASSVKRTSGDSGNTLASVFSNNGGTIPGKLLSNGSACVGNATAGYERSVLITVVADSDPTPKTMTPFALSSVPSALVAERAESLEGIKSSGFLQVKSTAPHSLSQSNLENIFLTTNYAKLTDLLAGSSSLYVHSTANGTILAPPISGTPASPAAGQLWYDAGVIKYYDGSSTQTLSAGSGITSLTIGSGLTPTGTITTGGSTIAVDTGVTAGKIVQVQTGGKLPALDGSDLTDVAAATVGGVTAADVATGAIAANSARSSSTALTLVKRNSNGDFWANNVGLNGLELIGSTSGSVIHKSHATTTPYTLTWPAAVAATNGYVLSSDTSGNLSWVAPSTGGLSAVSNSANLANGKIWIGDAGGKAQEQSISGDATLSSAGAVAVSKIQGTAISSTTPTTSGQTLRFNGTQWAPAFVAMTDLRSSVTGSSSFASSCANNQTLVYNSVGDVMSCSNISLPASQITGTVAAFVLNGGQAGAVTAGTSDANPLSLQTNGTTRLNITSGGYVGIGTSTPSAPVHVHTDAANGEVRLSSSGGGATAIWSGFVNEHYRGTASNGYGAFNLKLARGTMATPTATLAGDVIGSFAGFGHDGTNEKFIGAMILEAEGNTTSSNPPGKINFLTSGADGGGTRMSISSGGNVGIGVISPTEKLSVYDHANTTGYRVVSKLEIGNNSDGSQLTRMLFGQTAPNSFFLETSDHAYTKGQLILQPWGGNVGIGTTAPSTELEVAGSGTVLSLNSTSTNTTVAALNCASGGYCSYTINAGSVGIDNGVTTTKGYNGTWTNHPYALRSNGTEWLTILPAGNVGIGTTSPSSTLQVNGTTTVKGVVETVVAGGTCSTSYTIDPSAGTMFTLTLNGACSIGVTGLSAGQSFSVKLTQSSTTAPTFDALFKWPAGTQPTWSTSATKYDILACASFDGSTLQCTGMVDVR